MPNTGEMVDLSGTREYKILEPGICRGIGVCCRVRAPLLAQMPRAPGACSMRTFYGLIRMSDFENYFVRREPLGFSLFPILLYAQYNVRFHISWHNWTAAL